MIIAKLDDCDRYAQLQAGLATGFGFLRSVDVASLADGRHEVDGENAFAIVARGFGRGQADSPLEYHRRYLDIQYVISGLDLIGWQPTADCRHEQAEFDAERDIGFFVDRPGTWCRVPAGCFAIFYPEDAHAPLGGTGPVHKVVVKIAVDFADAYASPF